jgi:hypothetical protein
MVPAGNTNRSKLERRVVEAAEDELARQHYVTAVDVLIGMGWLTSSSIDQWRQGRVDSLERVMAVNLHKISDAMSIFREWAVRQGLKPSETVYVSRTRDRHRLQFSVSGEEGIERAYRTHWISPALSEAKQQKLADKQSKAPDLVVISALRDWACEACERTGDDLLIMEGPGPLCLSCADLDHLVFLAAGDAAMTRRAKKASALHAVVVRFNRSRQRYERQGLLVEESALIAAEQQCLADDEARQRRRVRDEGRRADHDIEFVAAFAAEITRMFPGCPPERAEAIASHAGKRGSGRVGRSSAGRKLDPEVVRLAVVASIRHTDTSYDELLMTGVPRLEARDRVRGDIDGVITAWRSAAGHSEPAPAFSAE